MHFKWYTLLADFLNSLRRNSASYKDNCIDTKIDYFWLTKTILSPYNYFFINVVFKTICHAITNLLWHQKLSLYWWHDLWLNWTTFLLFLKVEESILTPAGHKVISDEDSTGSDFENSCSYCNNLEFVLYYRYYIKVINDFPVINKSFYFSQLLSILKIIVCATTFACTILFVHTYLSFKALWQVTTTE